MLLFFNLRYIFNVVLANTFILYCVSVAKSSTKVYCRYRYSYMHKTMVADAQDNLLSSVYVFGRFNMADSLHTYIFRTKL